MNEQLIKILKDEDNALKHLLSLLKKQYEYIMSKDVFSLEEIVDNINDINKHIAQQELSRRKLVGNNKMSIVVNTLNDKEIENEYREIKKVVAEVKLQKDTNDLLIKQELSFTAHMLNIINPRREVNTYTSLGNLSR